MGAAIVDKMVELLGSIPHDHESTAMVFSGGFRVNGTTEAAAMANYCKNKYHPLTDIHTENISYRTHNNAVEALKYAADIANGREATIVVVDHPAHIKRTKLSFRTARRLYFKDKPFRLKGIASVPEYDANVPGQAYWATEETFASHERSSILLYELMLFRPWSRFGFWLLRTVWPSSRQ
ncbi:YdcF family protein [Patescibacteria group bacterium]|nr:YdcF family protein [Patescibacteria group bacterium]